MKKYLLFILIVGILALFWSAKGDLFGGRILKQTFNRNQSFSYSHEDEIRFPIIRGKDILNIKSKYGTRALDKFRITPADLDLYIKAREYVKIAKPKEIYKVAFIYVNNTLQNTDGWDNIPEYFQDYEIEAIDQIRQNLPMFFSLATYNKAGLDTSYPLVKMGGGIMASYLDPLGVGPGLADISQEFYKNNPDEFDFIYLFARGDGVKSKFNSIKADYTGGCHNYSGKEICLQCFDNSADFGSDGKLKGIITMTAEKGKFPVSDWNSYNEDITTITALYPNLIEKWEEILKVNYFELVLALHELEHAWSLHLTIPKKNNTFDIGNFSDEQVDALGKMDSINFNGKDLSHFGTLVQSKESLDPHDAIYFEVTNDKKVKICPKNIPPFKPYRFHPLVLYFMGLMSEQDFNEEFKYAAFDASNSSIDFTLEKLDNDCFFYNYTVTLPNENYSAEPSLNTFTIKEISSVWPKPTKCPK